MCLNLMSSHKVLPSTTCLLKDLCVHRYELDIVDFFPYGSIL